MTGTVSNFMDVLHNFDTQRTPQDNVLRRLRGADATPRAHSRRLHFYGDDTWLKLFPDEFEKSGGLSSFFVTDTVFVDANVTAAAERTLWAHPPHAALEWDGLFLHYLGLDHIGHSQGPQSDLMRPKEREMDDVCNVIFIAFVMLFASSYCSEHE